MILYLILLSFHVLWFLVLSSMIYFKSSAIPDNSMSFMNFIRTFDTEQRANIAFVALTKNLERGIYI